MRAPTGQATVPGAPVDPAIISSSFAKPKPSESTSAKKENAPTAAPAELPKPSAAKDISASIPTAGKPGEKSAPPNQAVKPTVPAAIPPTPRAANNEGGATATVEKDVHAAFREFNKSEKLRVQEQQRSLARRDKAVKLNDLKKFAQNFKLTTEVPADLLPILARDEVKQREIKEKAKKHAEETKSTPPRSTATSAAATPADTKSKPSAARNDSGPTSPLATAERQPPQQRSRQSSTNMPGPGKGAPPHMQTGGHRQPGHLGQRLAMNTNMNRGGPPHHPGPIPDMRAHHNNMASPTTAHKFDPTKSFVPSAASKPFVPGGSNASSSSSPVRAPSSQPFEAQTPKAGNFFQDRPNGRNGPVPDSERVTLDNAFNPIPTLRKENEAALPEEKRANPPNAGLPPPHKTMPTWHTLIPEANREKSVKDMFPSTMKPAASPQHVGPNQFQHQLPGGYPHPGFQPQPGLTPSQTPMRIVAQPHHGPGTPHHYEEARGMQFTQSTSSVQPSPRPGHQFMYQPGGGPPGQHFQPGMVYGTSPGGYSMMTRQLSNNPHFQGQAPQMVPAQGAMYMNGVPGQVMYANGQPAFFAHQPHMMPGQPGQNGFPSPAARPVMMAPQGSQSGHNTPQVMTPYFQPGAPVAGMRYGGPQHHQQFAGQPQHFPQHPGMQRGPSGNFQPQMMPGPQGMMPTAQPPQDGGNE